MASISLPMKLLILSAGQSGDNHGLHELPFGGYRMILLFDLQMEEKSRVLSGIPQGTMILGCPQPKRVEGKCCLVFSSLKKKVFEMMGLIK